MLPGGERRQWGVLILGLAVALGTCGCSRDKGPRATVVITSAPVPDAEVSVGEVSYGPAPVTLEDVRPGWLVVVLEKEGFRRTAKNITIPEEGGLIEQEITLNPLVGYAAFKSTPPRAKVYLDGADYLGDTPLIGVSIPVGEHAYELRLENYKPLTISLTVEDDYQYSLVHVLKPMPAQLSVFSTPTGAQIWLNEELQAGRTPNKFSITPGAYTVSVHAKGFIMGERNIELGPNEERALEITLRPGDAPRGMVLVPAEKFIMGVDEVSPDERPQREIELDAFYIDKYEVTNEAFKEVFHSHTYDDGKGRYPVTGVSFNRACQYTAAVNKRLPTEAEWEKAARGTDGREYPWGNEFNKDRCNCAASAIGAVTKVGRYRTGGSPYGCMDMAGNACEWTSSWYQPYPGNPDVTKDYGQIFRVVRGGSYRSSPFEVRCVRRHYDRMHIGREDYGFRCAKDVE